jgi:hypothetical protein
MKMVLFNFMPMGKDVTIGTHGFSPNCVHMSPKLQMCLEVGTVIAGIMIHHVLGVLPNTCVAWVLVLLPRVA